MKKTGEGPNRAALVRELKKAFAATKDKRFHAALDAVSEELDKGAGRGRRKEWGQFEHMILWMKIQGLMRAHNLSLASACHRLAGAPLSWLGGKTNTKERLESRYQQADKAIRSDPEDWAEAESGAVALAVVESERRLKRKPSEQRKSKLNS